MQSTSNYESVLESQSIIIVFIILHCTNPLGRTIILLLATLWQMHLPSLTKIG